MAVSTIVRVGLDRFVITGALRVRLGHALSVLKEAADYAAHLSTDLWDFAVEIQQLQQLGLSSNDLRFLVRIQLVEHAREVIRVAEDGRRFTPSGNLHFNDRTCFVMTAAGIAAYNGTHCRREYNEELSSAIHTVRDQRTVPIWNRQQHLLKYCEQIVKLFKRPAANQESILAAFEEEGWPARIDDPLAPAPSLDSKKRLSDTIKFLNRKQLNHMIQFHGDGTGQGVIWEACYGLPNKVKLN